MTGILAQKKEADYSIHLLYFSYPIRDEKAFVIEAIEINTVS